jgi:hypothetical protein
MSDPLAPEPKKISAPPNINKLRSRIDQYARDNGLGINRVQQRVFTELMIGLLDRAEEQRARGAPLRKQSRAPRAPQQSCVSPESMPYDRSGFAVTFQTTRPRSLCDVTQAVFGQWCRATSANISVALGNGF